MSMQAALGGSSIACSTRGRAIHHRDAKTIGGMARRRKREPEPDPRPGVTLALDVTLTDVDVAVWCFDCKAPSASSVVALVTTAADPTIVLMRHAQSLCGDCGRSWRG